MADVIGAIGSQSHRAEDKRDLDNAGGMVMASVPPQNSIYDNNGGVVLTEQQRTGSIFC